MANKYETMEEPPEAEVEGNVDDGVYHPDQAVRVTSQSVRSLEPLIEGPVTLKAIFYDPNWTVMQKRCCIGVLIALLISSLGIVIALLVGLGRVVSYIKYAEQVREYGLHSLPDEFEDKYYFCPKDAKKCDQNKIVEIVKGFEDTLQDYRRMNKTVAQRKSTEYTTCDPKNRDDGKDRACFSFDEPAIGPNCTKANSYGYKDGNPCVLLTFREGVTKLLPRPYFLSNELFHTEKVVKYTKHLWPLLMFQIFDVKDSTRGTNVDCEIKDDNRKALHGAIYAHMKFVGPSYQDDMNPPV